MISTNVIWIVLTIISAISLILYWKGPNSIWGGLTLGVVVGFIWNIVSAIQGDGFHWSIIGKCVVVGVLLGVVADWLGRFSDYMRKKDKNSPKS
ncbi:MAG: hypothetical protein PHW62_05335 [Candidatus Ratteibacteria bacterium]|nr:hypothetical protein [Candidatus Ratteibacteria bacterium]